MNKSVLNFLFLLCVAFLASSAIHADNGNNPEKIRRNEISIGAGFSVLDMAEPLGSNLGVDNIKSQYSEALNYVANDMREDIDPGRHSGLHIAYKYYLSKRWTVGGTLFYKPVSHKRTDNDESGTYVSRYKQSYFGLAVEGAYNYFTGRKVTLYGLAGLGCTTYTVKEAFLQQQGASTTWSKRSGVKAAYQVTPFAIKTGHRWGCRWEFGYGYKGFVSGELYMTF